MMKCNTSEGQGLLRERQNGEVLDDEMELEVICRLSEGTRMLAGFRCLWRRGCLSIVVKFSVMPF